MLINKLTYVKLYEINKNIIGKDIRFPLNKKLVKTLFMFELAVQCFPNEFSLGLNI